MSARRLLVRAAVAVALASLSSCAADRLQRASASRPADCQLAAGPPLLGCFNAANLRAMVADPKELTAGHALTPASGAPLAKAVADYQAGPKPQGADAASAARTSTTSLSETN